MAAINRTLTLLLLFIMLFKSLEASAPPASALYITIFSITCASAGIMYDPHSRGLTDEISIKQGKLVGVKVEFKSSSHLKAVEMYLGIPYAAAPTGSQRFMPPGSPPQWPDVKYATSHQPVCPQNLPDINEERRKSTMSEGRVNYLKRLLPYLQDNQSEDCLYLNIYAPAQKRGLYKSKAKYPVIVFIHGESFEWNSGNPYDGSVLASYGEVVVVTLNFRLGILGFLRPGVGDNTLTNFGLLDQIAALQWVKENIEHFGGDSKCVTLMGHGTGAACVNYLMVSPVSRGIGGSGLFHRAILMSGTALADWALTTSNIFTIQVAQALNCPLKETNNEMAECLRKRRIDEIMAVKVEAPEFKTRFGPMVDGSVVPNDPVHLTGEYHDLFGRYELLYGVTELESYNLLDAVSLRYGMLEQDRDKKIRAYVQERFQYLPDMYLAETLKAYTDVSRRISDSSSQSIAENNRDTLLDILSDARVVAPMVQTANFHSSANPKSYFYVFSHRNMYGDFATVTIDKSIHGEELPYVFGVPIVKGDFPGNPYSALHEEFPSHSVFTDAERLLSEAVITFWTNFAKTGNPNAPVRPRFGSLFETDWPEYDSVNQMFLGLGIPPVIGQRYRSQMTTFWNTYLREAEKTSEYQGDDSCPGANTTGQDAEPGTTSTVAISIVVVIGLCLLLINLCACAGLYYQRDRLRAQERLMKRLYGHMPPPANNADLYIKHKGNGRVGTKNVAVVEMAEKKDNNKKKAMDQTVEQVYEAVRNAGRLENGEEEDEDDRELNLKRWELSRQCSHSTIDTHTKVTQWIASEMIQRYSPKLKRANFQQQTSYPTFHNNSMGTNLTSTFESPTERAEKKLPQRNVVKPAIAPKPQLKKVSVAIDATPKLIPKQVPLESVSKSMENLGKCVSTTRITFQQKRPALKRAETFRESLTKSSSSPDRGNRLSKSVTSISLQVDAQNSAEKGNDLPIVHKHSTSDPVSKSAKEAVQSNMNSLKPRFVDISLDTKEANESPKRGRVIEKSKTVPAPILDSKNKNSKPTSMSSPQASRPKINKISSADVAENKGKDTNQLADIKRKNYPKVLPNIPPEVREKQAKEFQKEWELVRNIASQKDDPQTHIYGRPRQQAPTTPGRSRKQMFASPVEPEAAATDESNIYPKLATQTSKKRDEKPSIPVVRKHQEEVQPPPTTQRPVLKRQPPVQCQQCAMLQMSPASPKSQKPQRIHRSDASTETKNTTLQEFKPQSKEPKQISTTSMLKSELSASKTGTVKRAKQKIDAAFQTEESAPDEEIPVVSPFTAHEGCVVCETLYGHLGKD